MIQVTSERCCVEVAGIPCSQMARRRYRVKANIEGSRSSVQMPLCNDHRRLLNDAGRIAPFTTSPPTD